MTKKQIKQKASFPIYPGGFVQPIIESKKVKLTDNILKKIHAQELLKKKKKQKKQSNDRK